MAKYRKRIRPIIYPLSNEFGEHFIFMEDNARSTRKVQEPLEEKHVTRLDKPDNWPNVTPTKYMWDVAARTIRNRITSPRTGEELTVAAIDE